MILTSVMAAAVVLFTAGCSNSFENGESGRYGSLVIGHSEESRALDYSLLTSATVSISGNGMSTISKTVSVTNGSGEIVINKIPVGNNRVVTVASNVDGAVITEVVDITPNCTDECNVTWNTTARANIFKALIESNKDVSSLEKTFFDSYIPDVHASLVNSSKIASDYISGSFGTADSYILDYGTVILNAKNADGYLVQVTDIASERTTVSNSSNGTKTYTLKAYPGTWKAKVFDADGTLKETKDVVIASGKETKINIVHIDGSTPVTGKIIVHVPESLGYKNIWAWATSGSTNYTGGTWPGKEMTLNGSYYDYTIEQTACKVIFNKGNSGQTNDLYITEGEWNYIGGASGTEDTNGSKISSNFEPATVQESLTVTVENPPVPMKPTVTANYADGDEIDVNGSVIFTVTSENAELTSGTYTVGSKTGSLSVGKNTVALPSGISSGYQP